MLGTYFTFPELLLWIPFVTGLIAIFIKNAKTVKAFALFSSLATLVVSVISLCFSDVAHHQEYFNYNNVSYVWMPYIGSSFSVGLDGMGYVLTFLTAFSFPLVFAVTYKSEQRKANGFYALMLLFQAGLMGVFIAMDGLLFYFFWELALIPAYFLCSIWGGEKRIAATFKFFVYTFVASLLMLIGIIYLYWQTTPMSAESAHSFSLVAFYNAALTPGQQTGLFWLFFLAFAVKMPIWPFHTWQPNSYEQAPYPTVMIMSGVMVKMGVFAMIRWLLPVFPAAVAKFDSVAIILSVIGIIYASCIAIVQDDLKRLVAWASIAHLGLMGAAIFAGNAESLQGTMLAMLNHGVNILALWIIVDIINTTTGVRKISELCGLAQKSPALSIFFLVILLANIGLPLTNSFVSEFLMLTGLFQFNKWYAALACTGVILSAVYMLNMMKNVFYGKLNPLTENAASMTGLQKLALSVIVIFILVLGIYPELVLRITDGTVTNILGRLAK